MALETFFSVDRFFSNSSGDSCVCIWKDNDDMKGKVVYGKEDIKAPTPKATSCEVSTELAVCNNVEYKRDSTKIDNSSKNITKKIETYFHGTQIIPVLV